MKLQRTLVALGAAALLVAPATAAFAQQGPPPWANGNSQYQRHDRDDNDNDHDNRGNRGNRRHDGDRHDEHHDRGRHNGWNNPNNPNYGRNGGYNNGGYNGQYGQRRGNGLSGTVSSFSPFNLYLQNGTHVELHQGTVINPTGATPQPGQRVQVSGHWNADGTFAADQINLY